MGSRVGAIGLDADLPSLGLINLSVGVKHNNGISASLFAQNLSDERKKSVDVPHGAGGVLRVFNMNSPRTIGLRVGYQF